MNTNYTLSDSEMFVTLSIFICLVVIAAILMYVFTSAPYYVLFKKAGVNGWEAFAPVYRKMCLFQIVGIPSFLVVLAFIPFVNIIYWGFVLSARYLLAKRFRKSDNFALCTVLFPFICTFIMAIDKHCFYVGGLNDNIYP